MCTIDEDEIYRNVLKLHRCLDRKHSHRLDKMIDTATLQISSKSFNRTTLIYKLLITENTENTEKWIYADEADSLTTVSDLHCHERSRASEKGTDLYNGPTVGCDTHRFLIGVLVAHPTL